MGKEGIISADFDTVREALASTSYAAGQARKALDRIEAWVADAADELGFGNADRIALRMDLLARLPDYRDVL